MHHFFVMINDGRDGTSRYLFFLLKADDEGRDGTLFKIPKVVVFNWVVLRVRYKTTTGLLIPAFEG
jgi:hypothetical protein